MDRFLIFDKQEQQEQEQIEYDLLIQALLETSKMYLRTIKSKKGAIIREDMMRLVIDGFNKEFEYMDKIIKNDKAHAFNLYVSDEFKEFKIVRNRIIDREYKLVRANEILHKCLVLLNK